MTDEMNHTQRYIDAMESLRDIDPDRLLEAVGRLWQEEHDWVIILDERLKIANEALKYSAKPFT